MLIMFLIKLQLCYKKIQLGLGCHITCNQKQQDTHFLIKWMTRIWNLFYTINIISSEKISCKFQKLYSIQSFFLMFFLTVRVKTKEKYWNTGKKSVSVVNHFVIIVICIYYDKVILFTDDNYVQ